MLRQQVPMLSMLEISYTYKNAGKQFFLKTKMICDSRNLIYVVICPTYIGETETGNPKLIEGLGYTGNIFDSLKNMKNLR